MHQILTGWTALALLWAAFCFARTAHWRPLYSLAVLFPLGWSYLAIYHPARSSESGRAVA